MEKQAGRRWRSCDADIATVMLHTLERQRFRTDEENKTLKQLLAVSRLGNSRGSTPLREYVTLRD